MIYAHAAYGFGAAYLEHGLFYLIRIHLKHLWSRQRTLNTLNETMTIKGDTNCFHQLVRSNRLFD